MNTIDIIKTLCKKKGISISALEKDLGYGNGSLAKAKVIPSDRLYDISTYFSVSMEYLMGKPSLADYIVRGINEETGEEYYINVETAQTAQQIFEEDKVLFDVYRSADKERLIEYAKKLKALRDMEEGEM